MKKIIYIILIVLFLPTFLLAQGHIAEIWTQPAVYNANEQVSFYFDISGTELADVAEDQGVCVWTWFPADPGETWGSPSDKAKLTHVKDNVWRWDLIPTEFYGVAANDISAFYGQLQTHTGDKISPFAPDQDPPNDIKMYSLAAISGDEIIDYFPKQFKNDRPLSVLLNANNTYPDQCGDNVIQGELANAPNIHVHGGVNGWTTVVENNAVNLNKTELTHLGNGIYRWDFIPINYFELEQDDAITNISAVFASNDWTFIGKNIDCSDFFIEAPDQPEVVIPTLNFFPQKISKKDILCIFRANNEANVSKLSYSITAGTEIINGNFEGNSKEMSAYINLVDLLSTVESINKINVVIIDNTGRKVTDIDVPLVQLND